MLKYVLGLKFLFYYFHVSAFGSNVTFVAKCQYGVMIHIRRCRCHRLVVHLPQSEAVVYLENGLT